MYLTANLNRPDLIVLVPFFDKLELFRPINVLLETSRLTCFKIPPRTPQAGDSTVAWSARNGSQLDCLASSNQKAIKVEDQQPASVCSLMFERFSFRFLFQLMPHFHRIPDLEPDPDLEMPKLGFRNTVYSPSSSTNIMVKQGLTWAFLRAWLLSCFNPLSKLLFYPFS